MSLATPLPLSDTELATADAPYPTAPKLGGLTLLKSGSETEVLEFLNQRPIHTVIMAGCVRDNGLVSKRNRGSFYCYRNPGRRIEGVALIGHATLFETRSDASLNAFAQAVHTWDKTRLVIGERHKVEQFWSRLANDIRRPYEVRGELLFARETKISTNSSNPILRQRVNGLRLAGPCDLELVARTHARMAVEELGLDNPIAADPDGFLRRCAQRIDQGRVWVLIENHTLIFKADVVSETPEATYLEGIFVEPDRRGQGYGLQCLSQLSEHLLSQTSSLCLFVNERNTKGQAFYRNLDFRLCGYYTTILFSLANHH